MSIRVPIHSLSDEQRVEILQKLSFRVVNQRTQTSVLVSPYRIHNNFIYLPYAWAIEKGFTAPLRNEYPATEPKFNGKLREYQQQVKKQAITQLDTGSCVLALRVGWGKSIFSIYLACKLKMPTLIVVPGLSLIPQWTKSVLSVCPESTCHFLKPTKKNTEIPKSDFYIINAQNIPKYSEEFLKTIGVVIVDELHLLCTDKLQQSLLHLTPRYLIGLSATPYRLDGFTKLVDLNYGKSRIAVKLNRHHLVYAIHTGFELEFKYAFDGTIDWNSLLESQSIHPERNQMILDIVEKFSDKNFLILVKRVSHGMELHERLLEMKQDSTHLLGTAQTFDENARILIATIGKVGTGFSHEKMDALIVASDMRDFYIQRLGRVFRTELVEPVIFDLIDDNAILKRHFASRKKIYKDVGGTIMMLDGIDKI